MNGKVTRKWISDPQVGVIGYWDVVAFDEVGEGVTVRDKETFQLMKQYMANGNSIAAARQ